MSKVLKTRILGGVRFSLLGVFGIVIVLAVCLFLFCGGTTPEATADKFMNALAKKDVKTLTELSYLESPVEPLEKQWDHSVNRVAKNLVFMWQFLSVKSVSDELTVVTVVVTEFKMDPSYGVAGMEQDPVEIPFKRINGNWKVDLESLSRKFFPGLPR